MAMSHLYSSSIFWSVIAAILALAQVILGILVFVIPWIFGRRIITYVLRAAEPLIHFPVNVTPDLQVTHHGKPVENPHIIVVGLSYRGRKDLRSETFDKGEPLCVDVGSKITALIRSTFTPSIAPTPAVKVNDTRIEIGPSLIRKRLAMEFVVLTDGPDAVLNLYSPLADVKIRQQKQEEDRRRTRSNLLTISGWTCVAFILWWIIEDPTGAAHVVHNIGTFLSSALGGISKFFTWR
jgi:hypothetical protein